MSTIAKTPPAVHYPDFDGLPIADNTLQFEWIVTTQGNLDLLFREREDVFVAGDHLIYPVEGDPNTRQAPDVYVAFGRPKGHRGSYKVFDEDNVFPQVVFEVWSPGNRFTQMEDKRDFYARYGAEEYYIVYPEFPAHLDGWRRDNGGLVRVAEMDGHVSPRLGIRFELRRGNVAIFRPDGRRFLSYVELGALQQETEARATTAEHQAEEARQKAERLAARLRELGVDPDNV
ncbi:MAG: Uma2 family endonuclease [Gemmataceae bacterium]|nr:Uma2 family endonuclease [Gemmataceae bacterium]